MLINIFHFFIKTNSLALPKKNHFCYKYYCIQFNYFTLFFHYCVESRNNEENEKKKTKWSNRNAINYNIT